MIVKRFKLKEIQQLILDGWHVEGDRRHAYRNGIMLDPATYRKQQAKRSV